MEPALDRLERSLARVVAVVTPVVGCGLLASCLLSGYDKAEGGSGGSGGAGGGTTASTATTGGGDGGEGGGLDLPACDTTDLPAAPASGEPGGPIELYFALRTIRFGDPSNRASVPGFDLDRADGCRSDCAGEDECGLPEYLPELSTDEKVQRCDFVDGIDNSGAHLFARLAEDVGADETTLSDEAAQGIWSLILRVSDWNGLPDDPTVRLALFSTPGFGWMPDDGVGGAPPPPPPPLWNGSDVWPIDERSLEPGSTDLTTPSFVDLNAYVSGGVIVGALGGTFYAGTNALPIELAEGVLVAPIADLGLATMHLENAVFAGRWSGQKLIDALAPIQVNGIPLCNLSVIFEDVVADVCKLLDVTTDGLPGACDALSFAFELDAYRMLAGAIVQPDDAPIGCGQQTTCADVFDGE